MELKAKSTLPTLVMAVKSRQKPSNFLRRAVARRRVRPYCRVAAAPSRRGACAHRLILPVACELHMGGKGVLRVWIPVATASRPSASQGRAAAAAAAVQNAHRKLNDESVKYPHTVSAYVYFFFEVCVS